MVPAKSESPTNTPSLAASTCLTFYLHTTLYVAHKSFPLRVDIQAEEGFPEESTGRKSRISYAKKLPGKDGVCGENWLQAA